MTTEVTSTSPVLISLLATGTSRRFPFGRLAIVLGDYDVQAATYRRDDATEQVDVHVEVLAANQAAGDRLRRRLKRCVGVEDVRQVVHVAARSERDSCLGFGAAAEPFASDAATDSTTDAVQLLGGYGYTQNLAIQRRMPDTKITQDEGTNQVQRIVMARSSLDDMKRPAYERWFTTAQFQALGRPSANGRAAGAYRWIAHAKQMGTNLTACGENAFTWSKLWHLPFDQAKATRCQACVDAVTSPLLDRNRFR
jgi:hypothetical protein